ncbi:MAG TPA: hypothetical protein VHO91_11230, partial [Rhodopila sp.]|nr:hypothetical protein [Rhodopila sp.]
EFSTLVAIITSGEGAPMSAGQEGRMQFRRIVLAALAAVTVAAAAAPAFADDGWRLHQRQEWREHNQREHDRWGQDRWEHAQREHAQWEHVQRDHEWREHEWNEHHYPPPVVAAPTYGYYAPPPVYNGGPVYYR